MNIVYFTKTWPRRGFNSNVQRPLSIIETLVNNNHQLTVCSEDIIPENKEILKRYPLNLIDINPNRINNSLHNLKSKPNMFVFDSVQTQRLYSAFLYNKWNQCPRVLDISSLPKVEKWRKANYQGIVPNVLIPPNSLMAPKEIQDILDEEQQRSINRSDYVLTGNEFVHHLLERNNIFKKKVSFIPNAYPLQQFTTEVHNLEYRPFANRKHFVSFGNFDRQTNREVLHCLFNDIWPIIRKSLPEVELHVYGAGDQKFLKAKKGQLKKNGIFIMGLMEDSLDLSNYRALLAPYVTSVGLRGKISQTFFSHLPVVTTPVGAEGMFLESIKLEYSGKNVQKTAFAEEEQFDKEEISLTEKCRKYYENGIFSPKNCSLSFGGSYANFTCLNFAENAVNLYQNEELWNSCLKIAHNTIMNKFNEVRVERLFKKTLVQVEMAAYQGRGKGVYEQEWKRYTRSSEFHQKMKS